MTCDPGENPLRRPESEGGVGIEGEFIITEAGVLLPPPDRVREPEKKLIDALGMEEEPEIVAPLAPPAGVPPAMATPEIDSASSVPVATEIAFA